MIIIVIIIVRFSHQRKLVVFHCSLNDCKSPQVSRTLLSIMANLNNAVVGMVSILPLISYSSRFFPIPCASTANDINVILFLGKVYVFTSHFPFFDFHCGQPERQNQPNGKLFFLLN